jgi:hypothetical protein
MTLARWPILALTSALAAQEPAPFAPESANPWLPSWELTLRGDHLEDPGSPSESFQRLNAHLHLRWTLEVEAVRLEGGIRAALGTDGNQFNAPRWDQEPSNGVQVDVAQATYTWLAAQGFGALTLGFQQNALLVREVLWDRDLRFLGASGRFGFRSAGGAVQEAGLRAEAGRVRTILGGEVDLAAAQAVLQTDVGPTSWAFHLGRWDLAWNAGNERLRQLPGHDPTLRQRMAVDALGASGTWNAQVPVAAHWLGSRNRETGEDAEEAQLALGSRERRWWPQVAATWQRMSSTGVLYPVNTDEWWYYRRARGWRFDLSVPLPSRWVVTATCLRQRAEGESELVTRTVLVFEKRF